MAKISVVINTLNEEKNIEKAIKSVAWADEVLVCDMHSDDKTAALARKLGAKVFLHKKEGYVEPARNFAVNKASNEWVLILDADEEVPESLAQRLLEIASKGLVSTYVKIPRKNIIFGKWMKASMWWPDLNIRFFKKGSVKWGEQIHRQPQTNGEGIDLPAHEQWAILHHNYQSVGQFIERMNRYTDVQSGELKKQGVRLRPGDLIAQPLSEFLSRFFASKGYQDGLHGLSLSFLQAFSALVVYLKLWERDGFKEEEVNLYELESSGKKAGQEIDYWFNIGSKNFFKKVLRKAGLK